MQINVEGHMGGGYGFMDGNGLWMVLGVLLLIFLVLAIVRMVEKR